MGYLAQTASLPERPQQPALSRDLWWQTAVLILSVGWLYWSILFHLAKQWSHDPNFTHGFFVPAFSLFVLWQDRDRLAREPCKSSSWGLLVVAFALSVLVVGVLGAELFLSRISLLLLIAGLAIFFRGRRWFRAVLFPWAFLILMIPIPAIVFTQITFPLQMLASKVAALLLPLLGVPVLREGNVINLPAMPLEVVEACSGIRSLLSLATLAIIYGYLTETRIWVRVVLALASIPIAVAANSLRIVGTGLLVQYWDPEKAEGFFHIFSGWLIFVVALAMLFLLHRLLQIGRARIDPRPLDHETGYRNGKPANTKSYWRFAVTAALLATSATFLQARGHSEILPSREPLASLPQQLGEWTGTDVPMQQDVLDILGPGDFLQRYYENASTSQPFVDLFLAYFPSQRAGDTIHSPKHCLPGSGWLPTESGRVSISFPGRTPFEANRYVIAKGDERQLVLYWYWAHDRALASEYWAKFYLVADSIRLNRSDGSLVRVITPLLPGEGVEVAQQRLLSFAGNLVPRLDRYIPR